jgi:hypothetical protein
MRVHLLMALALGALSGCSAQRSATLPPAPRSGEYEALLARARAGDSTVDYTQLRLAYAGSAAYAPYGSDADAYRDSARAALAREDFGRVAVEADSALAYDFLGAELHFIRGYAAEQLGDTATAAHHRAIGRRLVESILASGTGASADSPYVVISVAEEYAVLGVLGYRRGTQALSECRGQPCDVLAGTHGETGQERTFYFDIAMPYATLARKFKSR